MTYASNEQIAGLIMSYDFKKCFDKIEHSALIGALEAFSFSDYIVNWTKILFPGFTASVQNNGCFSRRIVINQGVHQGGCCSSFYFVVCTELLAIAIKIIVILKEFQSMKF